MDRTRQRELFWLLLIAGCVALFVAHRERTHRVEAHDRGAMADLFRHAQKKTVNPNEDIVTGSIAARSTTARPAFYVPLGSYGSIDKATRRYLDLAAREPSLDRKNKIRIETVAVTGYGTFHRVRMGNFSTVRSARAACARAGLPASECSVVEAR